MDPFNYVPLGQTPRGSPQPSSRSTKTEPRVQQHGEKSAMHRRAFSADVGKPPRVELPQKIEMKEKAGNAELIDRFVNWLKDEMSTQQVDEKFIDQLAQRFNDDVIEKLITKIKELTPKDIKAALGHVTRIDTGTPKSRDLYMFCLGVLKTCENAPVTLEAEKPEPSSGGPSTVKERVQAIEANVVASKSEKDLAADCVQVIGDYLTAVAQGEDESATAFTNQLHAI